MKDLNAKLIARRHPLYEAMLAHWNFVEETYEGGRAWFKTNLFRYIKEGDTEYADRVARAYRFNHTRQVVDLVDKHLFKLPVARRVDDAPEALRRFWTNSTLAGLDIDAFSRRISNSASKFGRVYVVVDSTSQGAMTEAEAKSGDARVYAYIVRPQDMLDISYDDKGKMRWALVREVGRDDEDPMSSSGDFIERYRLWTTDSWKLYRARVQRGRANVELEEEGVHGLGVVPIVQADHNFSEEPWAAPGLVDDVAYLDRANANYLSNLDAIIQDQTFSQLAMPAQGLMPGEEGYDKLVEMGTKRVFLYNGEAGAVPFYLSPDPKQAELILSAIGKIINEIYHSVGLSAERTKEDNGGGIDNASGVAKAYDFERVNSLLVAKAVSLEMTERRIATLACLWAGTELQEGHTLVTYPRDFDARSLYDEFEISARLSLLQAPDLIRRMQMQRVSNKLFPAASEKEQLDLKNSLKDWPPEDPMGLGQPASARGNPIAAANTQKTAKELAA